MDFSPPPPQLLFSPQKAARLWKLWLAGLLVLVGAGAFLYFEQFTKNYFHHIGLSRDVSWGLHIGQFTYFVGVAASAIIVLLPIGLHRYRSFRPVLLFGETLAIVALTMSLLFILVDIGHPQRLFNLILHPAPTSLLFWDMVVISGYLFLCSYITWYSWNTRRYGETPGPLFKKAVYLSVCWAFPIHTVTALIYCALPGRDYWFTAIMAARFLASAFCSGPAILLLLLFLLRRLTGFDPVKNALRGLTLIIIYAMGANIFFFLLELYTALYSGLPGHVHPILLLFSSPDLWLTWAMRLAAGTGLASFLLLLLPYTHESTSFLSLGLVLLVISTWLDKGLVLIPAGFSPNPFGRVTPYAPTAWEIIVALGILALGSLVLSLVWRKLTRLEMARAARPDNTI